MFSRVGKGQRAAEMLMDVHRANVRPLQFSTNQLPERDRIAACRDFFGPRVFGMEIEPAFDVPFHADVTVRLLPDVSLVSATSSPARFSRTPALLADGHDELCLIVSSSGGMVSQRGKERIYGPRDAVLVGTAEVATIAAPSVSRFSCLHIRRAALAPLVTNLDASLLRRVVQETEALRHLLGYVDFLERAHTLADPGLAQVAATHVCELAALVLGATRDTAFVAQGRGLRAARLWAIKRYVADNLCHHGLTVAAVAAQYRLTPRSVQRLFESEGTTFSDFLLSQRLARAYGLLSDGRHAGRNVSALALDSGFSDVSYFNRCFRRQFGMRPSDVRAKVLCNTEPPRAS
ncbi:MAG: helix-turn-helix domain-containing protein [Rhizobiales bacterium]|nr:helix-turn-helix domain-containing protein [Hyphomicrobiales bacterium]